MGLIQIALDTFCNVSTQCRNFITWFIRLQLLFFLKPQMLAMQCCWSRLYAFLVFDWRIWKVKITPKFFDMWSGLNTSCLVGISMVSCQMKGRRIMMMMSAFLCYSLKLRDRIWVVLLMQSSRLSSVSVMMMNNANIFWPLTQGCILPPCPLGHGQGGVFVQKKNWWKVSI